jgi:hypothetical protein
VTERSEVGEGEAKGLVVLELEDMAALLGEGRRDAGVGEGPAVAWRGGGGGGLARIEEGMIPCKKGLQHTMN